jgi:Fe2+ or Zn2+ uptake regulation protein
MTPTPLDAGELQKALETAGWRCTPQRVAVYEELIADVRHPTAEEVFLEVRRRIPKIGLATVYKALEVLVSIGVANKLMASTGASSARYDARREGHYHFRCLRTGHLLDLPTRFDPDLIHKLDPNLAKTLDQQGLKLTGYRLELVGYQEQESDRPRNKVARADAGGGTKA